MKIIQDGKPNFLFYHRSKLIEGNKLFDEFVNLLYALKEKGIAKAKSILNCLWGALVMKAEIKNTIRSIEQAKIMLRQLHIIHIVIEKAATITKILRTGLDAEGEAAKQKTSANRKTFMQKVKDIRLKEAKEV